MDFTASLFCLFVCCFIFLFNIDNTLILDRTVNPDSDPEICSNEKFKLSFLNETDHKQFSFENNVDPELNLYKDLMNEAKYTETQLDCLHLEGFSMLHFNSRSLYINFEKIKDYVLSLKRTFHIIAISETWISDCRYDNSFQLEGYDFFSANRKNKRGGGVGFFVQTDFQCKQIDCTVVDDLMESLTIEIASVQFKSITLSCIYRTPGSCIEQFTTTVVDLIRKIGNKKMLFVCGDFNIGLLKWKEHKLTTDFCNTMFSFGLWPLINKPSRITKDTATLIDNIFSTAIVQTTSGLLINDISDHLPIFMIMHSTKSLNAPQNSELLFRLRRLRTPGRLESLKEELKSCNWETVYVENPNQAYEAFLIKFLNVYDKHCPIKKYLVKGKDLNKEPSWMTKGLQKSCQKKKCFINNFCN